MFTIKIFNANVTPIEVIRSPINPIGSSSITTKKANYYVKDFSVDYQTGDIVVHVEDDIYYFDE